MTSSYSSTRLRMRKFCSSTLRWAFSICFDQHPGLDRLLVALLVDGAEAVEDLVDAVAGEQADEVVLGGEEEARLARVALAAGAAAQLVVDAARLVALGAADEEAAGLRRPARGPPRPAPRSRAGSGEALVVVGVAAACRPSLASSRSREVLGVAAELDVDAAAGHVRGDRDRAGRAGLGDDLALVLGVLGLGVEDRVRDALALELLAEQLGDLDGDRADEDGLAAWRGARRSRRATACHLPSLVL